MNETLREKIYEQIISNVPERITETDRIDEGLAQNIGDVTREIGSGHAEKISDVYVDIVSTARFNAYCLGVSTPARQYLIYWQINM